MNIKAAIFDMDGTLIDSLILWDIIWSKFGEQYLNNKNFKPSYEDDKKVRTLILKDAMILIHNNYKIGRNAECLLEDANSIMNNFYSNQVKLKKGVRDFLEHCKAQGIKMCIASATAPKLLNIAMEHCGIKEYFVKTFSCSDLGKGKDEPDIYLQAAEFLGTPIEETWVFEDSLTAIETATEIGMPTVGIYDRFNFGQDKIQKIATEYIGPKETLLKLVKNQ